MTPCQKEETNQSEMETTEQAALLEYPDQVVLFLTNNSNEQLISRLPALKSSPNLQKILTRIRNEGVIRHVFLRSLMFFLNGFLKL